MMQLSGATSKLYGTYIGNEEYPAASNPFTIYDGVSLSLPITVDESFMTTTVQVSLSFQNFTAFQVSL